jgi:hypothetical protein
MAELDGAERAALLLGHENVIDAKALRAADSLQSWSDDLFVAERFAFGVAGHPDQRDLAFTGVGFDPADIVVGAATEDGFGDDRFFKDVPEEVNDVVFGSEEVQVAGDDDSIKAVINKLHVSGEELKKEVHRRPFLGRVARDGYFLAADATPEMSCNPDPGHKDI